MNPKDLDPAFRRNLKAIRLAKGLSQAALADRLHVAATQISFWENGRNSPKLSTITKICEAMDCKPEDLLGERTAEILDLQTA